jgi:hypothetical protein
MKIFHFKRLDGGCEEKITLLNFPFILSNLPKTNARQRSRIYELKVLSHTPSKFAYQNLSRQSAVASFPKYMETARINEARTTQTLFFVRLQN